MEQDPSTQIQPLRIADVQLQVVSIPLQPAHWPETLTRSERRVATLLIRGLSYQQIALKCEVSTDTISAHVSAMLRKLDLESSHQLVAHLAS